MSRKQPFTEEEFEFIYSRVPRLCVDLIVKNEQGILLTLREKHGWIGQWHLPGCTIHIGETALDAVSRAASEELGIKVKVQKFLGYNEYHSEQKERGYGYSVSLVFLCIPLDKNITLDSHTSKFEFFKSLPENTIAEQKEFISHQDL